MKRVPRPPSGSYWDPDRDPNEPVSRAPVEFDDGTPPDMPEGYETYYPARGVFHVTARRVIADTAVRLPDTGYDPKRHSEATNWCLAVSRWRVRLRRVLGLCRFDGEDDPAARVEKMLCCDPPGATPGALRRIAACGNAGCCLFCYARSVATAALALDRGFAARPDQDVSVRLVVRRITGGAPRQVLADMGAAGGVACLKPISGYLTVVLLALTDRYVRGAPVVDPEYPGLWLASRTAAALRFPVRWLGDREVRARVGWALGHPGVRDFETYGVCRRSGSGTGRTALKYRPVKRKDRSDE